MRDTDDFGTDQYMGGVGSLIALMTVVPCLLAVLVSFWAKSRLARWLLRYGGLYFLAIFFIFLEVSSRCHYHDGTFILCRARWEGIGAIWGKVHLYHMLAYLKAAPFVAFVAVIAEAGAREKASEKRLE